MGGAKGLGQIVRTDHLQPAIVTQATGLIGVYGLVDHVPGIDSPAVVADHGGDMHSQALQHLLSGGRLPIGTLPEPVRGMAAPEQGMAAHRQTVLLGEGDDGIGRPEGIAVFLRMDAQGLHGVFSDHTAELLRQQHAIGTCELLGFDGRANLQAPVIGCRQRAGRHRLRGQGSGTPETQRHQQGQQ